MTPSSRAALPGEYSDTLNLLAALITEIQRETAGEATASQCRKLIAALRDRPQLAALPGLLLKTYNEVAEALDGIRLTRETIRSSAIDGLQDSAVRLTEVTATTESAAMELMNGLDRTLSMVDALEQVSPAAPDQLAALRGQINDLFAHLQFQDITTQQLRGVMQLLNEIEERISKVADLFDAALGGGLLTTPALAGPSSDSSRLAFNPDATTREAESRQAYIDAAFLDSAAR